MPRWSATQRMSTRSELAWGVTVVSASLLMRAVAGVLPASLTRDLLGVLSVLFLVGGVFVLLVGAVHRVRRASEDADAAALPRGEARDLSMAVGAVLGVGAGCSIAAMLGGALAVAIGTAVGAALGAVLGSAWDQRQRAAD